MAVQVWIGDRPEHPNERRAIVALANGLERLESLYLLLANFNVGGRTIDLAIIKHDAIFIVELKHCDGKIFGGVNGPWYVESANNERKRLNPGRKNPYNQVISYYYSLTNFLNDHRHEVLSENKAAQVNFRTSRRVVVIAPDIQEGSEIDVDWKVDLKGLNELPAFLVTERSAEINLTEEEMLAIPRVLGCTRWKDINELIVGVLPTWHAEERQTSAPAPAPEPAPAEPVVEPVPLARRLRLALQTSAGWLAAGMTAVVFVLLLLLLWRPMGPTIPSPPSAAVVSTPSGPAAGGVFAGPITQRPQCVWSDYQTVGKRWDAQEQRWISVGVSGTVVELAPEVVVTLQRVDYCDEEIRLTWSVRNNSEHEVRFPLHSSNISIRDPVGNEYVIADDLSEPHVVHVAPDTQDEGIAVVPRPVSQHAPSLLVRLKDEPFGEASWLVSLEGK
jgi:hypothetical protein